MNTRIHTPINGVESIDFSAPSQHIVDDLACDRIPMPDYFERVVPDVKSPVHLKGRDDYFVSNQALIDNDENAGASYESIVSTGWIYKRIELDKDEVKDDALRSALKFGSVRYDEVKDGYAHEAEPYKSFVLNQLYKSNVHGGISREEFYNELSRHYTQSITLQFCNCMAKAFEVFFKNKKTKLMGPVPKIRNENMYRDANGEIRLKCVQSKFESLIENSSGMLDFDPITTTSRVQRIPGTIAFEFILTKGGFKLDWISFSNSLLRDLCLNGTIENLNNRINLAFVDERSQAVGYAVNLAVEKVKEQCETGIIQREKEIKTREAQIKERESLASQQNASSVDKSAQRESDLQVRERIVKEGHDKLKQESEHQQAKLAELEAREKKLEGKEAAIKVKEEKNSVRADELATFSNALDRQKNEYSEKSKELKSVIEAQRLKLENLENSNKKKDSHIATLKGENLALSGQVQAYQAAEDARFINQYPNLSTFVVVMAGILLTSAVLVILCLVPPVAAGLAAVLTFTAGAVGLSTLVAGVSSAILAPIAVGIIAAFAVLTNTVVCSIKAAKQSFEPVPRIAEPARDNKQTSSNDASYKNSMRRMGSTGPVPFFENDEVTDVKVGASSPLNIGVFAQSPIPSQLPLRR